MSDGLVIRGMDRAEVDDLVDQAAAEGWNPGLHDADIFWRTDPEAFVAADLDGTAIGAGAITSYDGLFGFMGFFIVRPEYRGKGYGAKLWHARKRMLLGRLAAGATIGMDGVFEMQDWYARGGFVFSHRQIRFVATGVAAARSPSVVPIADVPFEGTAGLRQQPASRRRASVSCAPGSSSPISLALAARRSSRHHRLWRHPSLPRGRQDRTALCGQRDHSTAPLRLAGELCRRRECLPRCPRDQHGSHGHD